MFDKNLNKILINTQDNNLIVGEISLRDILIFIVKNL
jgi:hypothetical protein